MGAIKEGDRPRKRQRRHSFEDEAAALVSKNFTQTLGQASSVFASDCIDERI